MAKERGDNLEDALALAERRDALVDKAVDRVPVEDFVRAYEEADEEAARWCPSACLSSPGPPVGCEVSSHAHVPQGHS